MDKKEIAGVLEEISVLLELRGENPFKVRAFSNGARIVESLAEDLGELVKSDRLGGIKGIGPHLASVITELVEKGKSSDREELRKSIPAGLLELLEIQGIGPKRAKVLHEKLGIKSAAELEYACHENRLLDLGGFGEKSQAKILEAIKHRNKTKGYFLISQAVLDSRAFVEYLGKKKEAKRIQTAGSLRRQSEIVHDIDILVSARKPSAVHEAFANYLEVEQVLAKGETKSSVILKSGMQVDLRTVAEKEFPYALYYFTGSKEHNVAVRTIAKRMGLKISEYGIFKGTRLIPCKDEAELFQVLGLRYIPPELRENSGEIEAAKNGTLPKLVEEKDIKGIFHVHSNYSDGVASLEAMVKRAAELGYEYVGISDHSESAHYAGGLSELRLKNQRAEIDGLRNKYGTIKIFWGIESDILGDGKLDYPPRILKEFDFVIASVHSRFNMSRSEMTDRICLAIEHPAATILGHPTGRLLLGRAGYEIDHETIFKTAQKYGVAIEINANPHRLDLDWRVLKAAKAHGVKVSINPDAHSLEGLEDVPYGVGIARKGWLEKPDVLNTMPAEEMEAYLKNRKR